MFGDKPQLAGDDNCDSWCTNMLEIQLLENISKRANSLPLLYMAAAGRVRHTLLNSPCCSVFNHVCVLLPISWERNLGAIHMWKTSAVCVFSARCGRCQRSRCHKWWKQPIKVKSGHQSSSWENQGSSTLHLNFSYICHILTGSFTDNATFQVKVRWHDKDPDTYSSVKKS